MEMKIAQIPEFLFKRSLWQPVGGSSCTNGNLLASHRLGQAPGKPGDSFVN